MIIKTTARRKGTLALNLCQAFCIQSLSFNKKQYLCPILCLIIGVTQTDYLAFKNSRQKKQLCTKNFWSALAKSDKDLHLATPQKRTFFGLQYNILWYPQFCHQ